MIRSKYLSLAAIALCAVSLSGCFGDDETTNPVTSDTSKKLASFSKDGDGNALIAGAQAAVPGSFISVQEAFILTSGDKTAADEAAIDVVFSASENTASGVPTFYSPATAPNNLTGWTKRNATIIVRTSKASSAITTVNAAKTEIGSSTSQSAPVSVGTYVIKTESGLYGMLEVLSMTAAGNASTVTLKIFAE